METIYSIGAALGGGGIGNTAGFAAQELYKKNVIKKILCLENKQKIIPKNKIKTFVWMKYSLRYPLRGIQKFLIKSFDSYYWTDKLYDWFSSLHVGECDIFHYWRNHGSYAAKKAKKKGAIIYTENASAHPQTHNNLLKEEYLKFGLNYKAFTKKSLKLALEELDFADYVVVPKGFAYESFIKEGFSKEKLVPVNLGVNLKKFKQINKNKNKNKFRAVFVGNVCLGKGVQYLLEAWDKLNLKNSELLIVGPILQDIKEIVSQYNKNKSIKFIKPTDPLKYYKNSDILVFPSLCDGFGLVILEAMACGLPVIVTENTGVICRNKKEGFIIPIRSSKDIAKKIKYFYDHPLEIRRMGKNAKNLAGKYSWTNYGKALLNSYKSVLKDNNKDNRYE
jgi:glycosyltransferase involved in cell wall biosynthesis